MTDSSETRGDSYEGAAFHPSLREGREPGHLVVTGETLRFIGATADLELPFDGLTLRAGGANDRLLFFSHPLAADWSVYTTDDSILGNPRLHSEPGLIDAVDRIRRGRTREWIIIAAVLTLIAVTIAALFFLKDPLVAAAARRVPVAVEEKLGNLTFGQVRMGHRSIDDPSVIKPLQQLVDRISTGAANDRYKLVVHVVSDPSVNAFALPGGHVLINTGLLMKAGSAEEISGVLGHEIAHVTRQHSVRQIISTIGLFAIVQALFGDMSGIAAVLADGGARLLTIRFSRDFETEADESGVDYLVKAAIDPAGIVTFFGRLKEEEKKRPTAELEKSLQFLSTHPATDARIEHLRQKIARLASSNTYRPIELDLSAVQRAIAAAELK